LIRTDVESLPFWSMVELVQGCIDSPLSCNVPPPLGGAAWVCERLQEPLRIPTGSGHTFRTQIDRYSIQWRFDHSHTVDGRILMYVRKVDGWNRKSDVYSTYSSTHTHIHAFLQVAVNP
jgi:hypothetical protein